MRENGNGKQTSAWKHIGTIARREFWTTVRRREFLLMTFGLPILYLVIGAISGLATASTMSGASSKAKSRVIGFYDQSGKLDRATLEAKKDDGGVVGQVFVDEKTGQAALKAKKIRSFVVVSEDYLKSHAVTVYLPASVGSAFSSNRERAGGYAELMKRALLAGKVQPIIAESVLADTNSTTRVYNEKTGVFEKPNLIREIGKFAVPYIFSLLLLLAVIFSSSYLVHGIVDEKENRIIEVLLSAVSHEELLAGKLLGLGGVGLLQLGLWLCTGSGVTLFFGLQVLQSLGIGWDTMGVAALMFLFGYALYASLMVGVGSLGTSWKESQQMTGVAVSFLVAPFRWRGQCLSFR